ncbi:MULTISPECIES: iron chaperone [Pontibacter]|uniref:iron chaperone n=1 Tax=Pontibacter TaxID=323449 RepID=UPI001C9B818B|nr:MULTISPECIES: DUF1801 domain-containing protein [Pontibacter]
MNIQKPTTFEAYSANFPEDISKRLTQLRETIKAAVPEAEEIFSYGIPGFKANGKKVWFAGYKQHIGLYPMYGMEALEAEIAPYRGKRTKDTLHFPHNKPLPLDLIAKIVTYKLTKL